MSVFLSIKSSISAILLSAFLFFFSPLSLKAHWNLSSLFRLISVFDIVFH